MRGTQKQKNHLKWNAGNGVLHENEVRKSVFNENYHSISKFFPKKKNIEMLLRMATKLQTYKL